jgi:hypothetical protein
MDKKKEVVLWVVAVALMIAAAGYQRRTGPSYPARGEYAVAGQTYEYRLPRNALTSADMRIAIDDPGDGAAATLYFKRYRTDDPFTSLPLAAEDDELVGFIPAQPAAGKVEYFLILEAAEGRVIVPGASKGNVVMRFKDRVPLLSLLPHIFMMFFAILFGMRAGLAAVFSIDPMRRLTWVTLGGMTLGGMILGPIAQKYAFGAYWTGFPFDYDLTDNKVLIMWLVWVIACLVIGKRPRKDERVARLAVVLAALVMAVVYVIPHSARGTELDYELLEQGVEPADALRSGRESP